MIRKVPLLYFLIILLSLFWNLDAYSKCLNLKGCTLSPIRNNTAILSLDDLATLPENIIFLGGRLTDNAHRSLPVLLISRDSGRTWNSRVFGFEGAGIENIRTYGITNVWATITFQQEGLHNPEYLLRSVDAGNSWCVVSLAFIDVGDPIIQLDEFRFFDDSKGIMSVSGSHGSISTYSTEDGGINWDRLWKRPRNASLEIDTEYRYPGFEPPPNHAPIWTKQDDFYKITGVLRLHKGERNYRVEQYVYSEDTNWSEISNISEDYKFGSKQFMLDSETCPNRVKTGD